MLSINSLKRLYFLPDVHDMRFNEETVMAFIKGKLGKDPYNGDVFLFMSRNRRKLRMVHYENNAFYMQSKTFKKGYRFMKIEKDESGRTFYEMSWKDVVALLECHVIEVLKLSSGIIENAS